MCKMYKYAEVEARAQALSFPGGYWAKESWSSIFFLRTGALSVWEIKAWIPSDWGTCRTESDGKLPLFKLGQLCYSKFLLKEVIWHSCIV